MDYNNIFKIWGFRRRLLLTETTEIDLVTLKKDTFCSTHSHKYKINKFVVVSGKVRIDSEYGSITLSENESFEVRPPLIHRFYALEDSTMIELAYVETGTIDNEDINRLSQGGRIIENEEMTLTEMRKQGVLDLPIEKKGDIL